MQLTKVIKLIVKTLKLRNCWLQKPLRGQIQNTWSTKEGVLRFGFGTYDLDLRQNIFFDLKSRLFPPWFYVLDFYL